MNKDIGNSTGYIKIDGDGDKIYRVIEYFRHCPSTSTEVELTLETPSRKIIKKTVMVHCIEWIEDGAW